VLRLDMPLESGETRPVVFVAVGGSLGLSKSAMLIE
jgi:hypothetical protein